MRWDIQRVRGHRIFLSFLGIVAMLCFVAWVWFALDPGMCRASDRLVTPEEARSFGIRLIRQDNRFWQSIDVSEAKEIDQVLSEQCCKATKGDYFIADNSRWRVYLGGQKEGRYDFQYEVFFSECGKAVRVETLILQSKKMG